jgi:hypothetical protein
MNEEDGNWLTMAEGALRITLRERNTAAFAPTQVPHAGTGSGQFSMKARHAARQSFTRGRKKQINAAGRNRKPA